MEITKLIIKKLTSQLSEAEEKEFDSWLRSSHENEEIFNRISLIQESGKDIRELGTLNEIAAWDRVLQKVDTNKTSRKRTFRARPILRYAAIFIGLLGFAFWYLFHSVQTPEKIMPPPDKNAITLQLENGEIKVLSEDGSSQIKDKEGNLVVTKKGSNLAYSDSTSVEKLVYNTLTVPYAKRFGIQLSDGTKIHLNSGSSIKYPVKFIKGANREVFLSGEAFFEVTEDAERPFMVSSDNLVVTVLGTTFNVKAYPEDKEINTVLVSGSVGLSNKDNITTDSTLLKPGHMASWDKTSNTMAMEAVDTDLHTSWIHGRLILKRTPFKQIIPKLQRHYNISITNNYPILNNQVFTASYDIETIEEVMGSLSEIIPFYFEVDGNEITINKPEN
ncbi:FecR family protein [Ulvibacterium sp.]|uniref:FecR family protein n=1 Tax=Ulvibacterium sp. TaxID=2665914 RepID=UPI003CC61FA8